MGNNRNRICISDRCTNGVICKLKLMRGGGAFSSGSTFEFRQCEDNEKYINPESYEEIRK